MNSVFQNIYLGDIAARNDIRNINALRIMIRKLAESVGQPLSIARLVNVISSANAKINRLTVISYLESARDSYLIFSLKNQVNSLCERETVQKYYFMDNGLLNLFLTDPETKLLENIVAVTLISRFDLDSVYYYQKNIEVDFYIPDQGLAIQVCYDMHAESTIAREVTALEKLDAAFPCRDKWIVTREQEDSTTYQKQGIRIIPLWKFLMMYQ